MFDVNALFLSQSVERLRHDFPEFEFFGIEGDFTTDLNRLGPGGQRLTVFFAGTVGNLGTEQRRAFFDGLTGQMDASDAILLGVDLVKDPARIEAAYNDPEGITAAFNRNALSVVNQRFGANFVPANFQHRAFYDSSQAQIEMRLRAVQDQQVYVRALDLQLSLAAGSEIRTEISCKFTRASLTEVIAPSGLHITDWYTDKDHLFALCILRKSAP
jgi:L-histidine N-alpha-methyltransferase